MTTPGVASTFQEQSKYTENRSLLQRLVKINKRPNRTITHVVQPDFTFTMPNQAMTTSLHSGYRRQRQNEVSRANYTMAMAIAKTRSSVPGYRDLQQFKRRQEGLATLCSRKSYKHPADPFAKSGCGSRGSSRSRRSTSRHSRPTQPHLLQSND